MSGEAQTAEDNVLRDVWLLRRKIDAVVDDADCTLDDLAAKANDEHELAVDAAREALSYAAVAGAALLAAKRRVPHGQWGRWLRDNFRGSERTAQGYMQLAANPQRVAVLGDVSLRAALRELSTPRKQQTVDIEPRTPGLAPGQKDIDGIVVGMTGTVAEAIARDPRASQLVTDAISFVADELTIDDRARRAVNKLSSAMFDLARLRAEVDETEGLQAGLGAHTAMALLLYDRIRERTIDVELRELLAEDPGEGR